MPIQEIRSRVEALETAWVHFKQANEQRLKEEKKHGEADTLTHAHMGRLQDVMDQCKERLDQLEVAASRPETAMEPEGKPLPLEGQAHYKEAFGHFLRKGHTAMLEQNHVKALSVGSEPDGGYLVTPVISGHMIGQIQEQSPLRQLAQVQTISTDSLEILEDVHGAGVGWTGETGPVTETTTPELGKKVIMVFEQFAQPKATQKLLDDASIDVEEWLAEKVAYSFAREEHHAFINGNGNGKPRGILSYPAGDQWGAIEQIPSGLAAGIAADNLVLLSYSLDPVSLKKASFLMHRKAAQMVRTLKDDTGQYIWQPGLAAGSPNMLLGMPVYMSSDMPEPMAGALAMALGDFSRGYTIVDRLGIRVMRDPYTDKPFVKFYTTRRVGGDVTDYRAIKLLKISA